jgi:hypothetical protein
MNRDTPKAPAVRARQIYQATTIVALALFSLPAAAQQEPTRVYFQDMAQPAGIAFTLNNAAQGQKHLPETMTGGIAVIDYNQDGKPDLFFVNGAAIPSLRKTGPEYSDRLYRNDGNWKFTDVTAAANLTGSGYGMGAAVGDFDNDGFPDLFVAGVRQSKLYRNQGDSTFDDVTNQAGMAASGPEWAVAAAWLDYDSDGALDLFVVNYLQWDPATERFCGHPEKTFRTYCHPSEYQGLPNRLYRNNADGTFEDVSQESGIAAHVGKGMSAAVADYNNDGHPDIFVANDAIPNFLFQNQGDGTFQEVAAEAGVAFNDDGRALSSMGAEFRDLDNDGRPDIFVTALANETFPWFRNLDNQFFEDATYRSGIGRASLPYSGWGAGAYDFNNDGWKDLFIAAGDVQDNTEVFSSQTSRQANRILLNQQDGSFWDASASAGKDFQGRIAPGRGLRRFRRRRQNRHRRKPPQRTRRATAKHNPIQPPLDRLPPRRNKQQPGRDRSKNPPDNRVGQTAMESSSPGGRLRKRKRQGNSLRTRRRSQRKRGTNPMAKRRSPNPGKPANQPGLANQRAHPAIATPNTPLTARLALQCLSRDSRMPRPAFRILQAVIDLSQKRMRAAVPRI